MTACDCLRLVVTDLRRLIIHNYVVNSESLFEKPQPVSKPSFDRGLEIYQMGSKYIVAKH